MKKRTHQGNFTLSIFVLIFIFFTNCKKDSNDTNVIVAETGTVTDIEGNVYKTVKIGSQWWMAENLKTTKYTDGNPIYGYSWYGNDITNKNIYGALYNWDAVESGKLAPQGWHIPSDDEWSTLSAFLGYDDVAGGKMKEIGTAHWNSPNTDANNKSKFTALPGGWVTNAGSYLGEFYSLNQQAYFWSSTGVASTYYALFRFLNYNNGILISGYDAKSTGMSVRCVK